VARRATGWSVVLVGSLTVFVAILVQVVMHSGLTISLDPWLARVIAQHRLAWQAQLFSLLTWLGSSVVLIPLGLVVAGSIWLRERRIRPAVLLALALGGAAALYDILKPLVGRMRPPAALQYGGPDTDFSFPSGHATQSASFYAMLVVVLVRYLWPRRRGLLITVATLLVLIVAASRLYLGVHWPTDVLGGLALGIGWFALLQLLGLRLPDASPSRSESPSRRSGRTAPG
jgi:undecaprenyl-diphosphatase